MENKNQPLRLENPKLFPFDICFPYPFSDCITHYEDVWKYDFNAQSISILNHCASLLDNKITASYNGKVQKPILWSCIVQDTGTAKSSILKDYTSFLKDKDLKNPEPESAYMTVNATYEAICKYSTGNPKGILYELDELATWIEGMDNFSNGNKPKFMELWNGAPFKVLRKGEAPVVVESHKVNILSYTQPDKVNAMVKNGDLSSGFTNRFVFANMFDNSFRYDSMKKPKTRYMQRLNVIYEAIWQIKPQNFVFSDKANNDYCKWYNAFADKYKDVKLLKNYLPKLNTYGIRIAPILHCMEHASFCKIKEQPSNEISTETIERVCIILEFFMHQFEMVLENRMPNYSKQILNEKRIEFQKVYGGMPVSKKYKRVELMKMFHGTYGDKTLSDTFQDSRLFIRSDKFYIKAIGNE